MPENAINNMFGKENSQKVEGDINQFISKGMKLLHSEQTRDGVLKVLQSQPNKLQAVSDAIVPIVQKIDSSARTAGGEIHDMIKLQGTAELAQQVIEIGEASGAVDKFTPEETQTALAITVQDYLKGEISAGRIDPNILQQEMNKGLGQLPPKDQEQINQSMQTIDQTAESYKNTGTQLQPQQQQQSLLQQPTPQGIGA